MEQMPGEFGTALKSWLIVRRAKSGLRRLTRKQHAAQGAWVLSPAPVHTMGCYPIDGR